MDAPTEAPALADVLRYGADRFDEAATALGRVLAEANVCPSHGIDHALDVAGIVSQALAACPRRLTDEERLERRLAALLHDADDRKFFPENDDYQNARSILDWVGCCRAAADRIVRMIGWVAASKNKGAVPPEAAEDPTLLYPRWADIAAGTGWGGVARCEQYNTTVARPRYLPCTACATSEADLWARVATPERYAAYTGDSASMVDHYYDKLLPYTWIETGNPFLDGEIARRREPLVRVALLFGRTGDLPAALTEQSVLAAERAELEARRLAQLERARKFDDVSFASHARRLKAYKAELTRIFGVEAAHAAAPPEQLVAALDLAGARQRLAVFDAETEELRRDLAAATADMEALRADIAAAEARASAQVQ
jgi:uncharacterized protein